MKVLFVTNRYPTDATPGDSPCIAQQRESLQRLGYDVDVLFIESQRSRWSYLKAVWRVFWTTQIRKRYDIVHAHYGYYCGLAACAHFSTPTVITFRGSDVLLQKELRISRLAAKRAGKSIVMSKEMKRVLGDDNALVIPYGVDLGLFKPRNRNDARKKLGLPEHSAILLFPYDPTRVVKRFDLVEGSIDILRDEFPGIQIQAVYDKPYDSICDYMNACDVMVLTSNTEGAPVAIREAMACNLPIVSVDVGDVSEIIENTDGCSIVERNPQDIANQVTRILRSGMRTDGRTIAKSLSVCSSARAIEQIYAGLLTHK